LVLIVRKLLLTAFALIVAVPAWAGSSAPPGISFSSVNQPGGVAGLNGSAHNGCTQDGVHELNVANLLENGSSVCGIYGNPFRNIDFSLH
jgi:hypothetical protein